MSPIFLATPFLGANCCYELGKGWKEGEMRMAGGGGLGEVQEQARGSSEDGLSTLKDFFWVGPRL